MNRTEGAQAIGRAAEILRVVALTQRSGATLPKVCRATNLSRSTAFRILRSLKEERLLDYDEETHRYFIGPLAYELGLSAHAPSDRIVELRERIKSIALRSELTTYLVVRSDTDVVCLGIAQGSAVIRAVPLDIGQRLPLGVGAGSLAILSSLEDVEVNAILAANAHKLTLYGGGRLTPAALRKRIALTRECGYAYSQGSVAAGIAGVGIMLFSSDSVQQLAVSVSLPANQIDKDEQVRLIGIIRKSVKADEAAFA